MDSIALFFFTIRLTLTLMTEFMNVFLKLLIGTKTFLLSFFLYSLMIVSTAVQIVFKSPPPQPQIILLKDRQAAETRISFWESLVATSPNRDSFLNLEKLYRYIDENDRAMMYRKRAFSLDPNNTEFKHDTWLREEEVATTSANTSSSSLH